MNLVLNLENARFVTGAHMQPLAGRASRDIGARLSRLALPEAMAGEKMSVRVFSDRIEAHSNLRGRVQVFQDEAFQADIRPHINQVKQASKASDKASSLPVATSSASDLKGFWGKKVEHSKHVHKASSLAAQFFKSRSAGQTHSQFERIAPHVKFSGFFGMGSFAVALASSFENYNDAKQSGASKALQREYAASIAVNGSKFASSSIKMVEAAVALRSTQLVGYAVLKAVSRVVSVIGGLGSLLKAALGTWKIYKKDCFFKRLEQSTQGVQDTAEKAQRIWSILQKEIAIDEQKVADSLEGFKQLDTVEEKLKDLEKSFKKGLGYRLESIGHALDSTRIWVKGKFGYKSEPQNAKQNKERKIADYMRSIRAELNKIDQSVELDNLSVQDANIQKYDLLNGAKYKLERELALSGKAKDIASVTSATFAKMLVTHQGVVNIENRLDQYKIIQIHSSMVKNYQENRMWEIADLVIDYVNGIVGFVALFVPGGLIVSIITNVLNVHWFGNLVAETFGEKIKRTLGMKVPPSFDSEIRGIYARFEGKRFTCIAA